MRICVCLCLRASIVDLDQSVPAFRHNICVYTSTLGGRSRVRGDLIILLIYNNFNHIMRTPHNMINSGVRMTLNALPT